jgi:hypothetical protein
MHQTLYSFRGAMRYFRHDFGSVVTGSNSIFASNTSDINSWADLMALIVNTQYVHRY